MIEQPELPQSLTDQIVSSTLAELAHSKHFDQRSLAQLRQLAANGTLKRPLRVIEALKASDNPAEANLHEAA